MADIVIKRNDTLPRIAFTLSDANGPVDLTGAIVKFQMKAVEGGVKIERDCTVEDAKAGKVSFSWQRPETDTAGSFLAEFEATWPDGSELTFPNDGYITVRIVEDLT